jgi:hypothetical protein
MLPAALLVPLALGIAREVAPALIPSLTESVTGSAKAGALAATVVDAAMAATGKATPQEAHDAVMSDPQASEAVRLALVDLDRAEVEALTERLRIDAADRAGARGQTVDLARAGSAVAWGAPVISLVVVLGFFVVMALLFATPQAEMPERTFNLLNMLFGALVLGFGQVCNYWLGSSAGSAAKSRTIEARLGGHAETR